MHSSGNVLHTTFTFYKSINVITKLNCEISGFHHGIVEAVALLDATQRLVVVCRRFETTYQSHLKCESCLILHRYAVSLCRLTNASHHRMTFQKSEGLKNCIRLSRGLVPYIVSGVYMSIVLFFLQKFGNNWFRCYPPMAWCTYQIYWKCVNWFNILN
jgi:hypothetical protein